MFSNKAKIPSVYLAISMLATQSKIKVIFPSIFRLFWYFWTHANSYNRRCQAIFKFNLLFMSIKNA